MTHGVNMILYPNAAPNSGFITSVFIDRSLPAETMAGDLGQSQQPSAPPQVPGSGHGTPQLPSSSPATSMIGGTPRLQPTPAAAQPTPIATPSAASLGLGAAHQAGPQIPPPATAATPGSGLNPATLQVVQSFVQRNPHIMTQVNGLPQDQRMNFLIRAAFQDSLRARAQAAAPGPSAAPSGAPSNAPGSAPSAASTMSLANLNQAQLAAVMGLGLNMGGLAANAAGTSSQPQLTQQQLVTNQLAQLARLGQMQQQQLTQPGGAAMMPQAGMAFGGAGQLGPINPQTMLNAAAVNWLNQGQAGQQPPRQ
jgi:hypothetical protein